MFPKQVVSKKELKTVRGSFYSPKYIARAQIKTTDS